MKKIATFLFLITAISGSVFSLEWRSWSLDFGATWQYNAEIGTEFDRKQPSKFMFNPGAAVFADWDGVDGGLYFRPGGWFSWSIEEVYKGIARPSGEEKIGHMKVLGLMLDAPFGYAFQIKSVSVGVQGGPALYLRFPMWTATLGTAEPEDFWMAYYGKMELLHLSLASWVVFSVSETMDIISGVRVYQPVSTFFTEAPIFHGSQVGLMLSLSFDIVTDED